MARPLFEKFVDNLRSRGVMSLGAAYEATGDLVAARQAYEAGLRAAPASARLAQGLARVSGQPTPLLTPQARRTR